MKTTKINILMVECEVTIESNNDKVRISWDGVRVLKIFLNGAIMFQGTDSKSLWVRVGNKMKTVHGNSFIEDVIQLFENNPSIHCALKSLPNITL